MALIGFHIGDPANRMTLKAMLEMDGHRILEGESGVPLIITDDLDRAVNRVTPETSVLVLCRHEEVVRAVEAMRAGVYGYIFLPFQPGEAGLMVQRALERNTPDTAAAPGSHDGPMRRLEEVESEHILYILRRCKNNQAKAARILGIGRNTLWRKLKKIETLRRTTGPGEAE